MNFFTVHVWEMLFALVAAVAVPYVAFLAGFLSTQKWIGTYRDGDEEFREEIAIFFRFGVVRGSAVLNYKEAGIERNAKYRVRGSEKDGVICAYYEGLDEGNRERGAFILRLSPNMSSYIGSYYFFGVNDVIKEAPYKWARKLK